MDNTMEMFLLFYLGAGLGSVLIYLIGYLSSGEGRDSNE